MNGPISVLLIEDNPAEARLVEEMLRDTRGPHFELEVAHSLREGVERAVSTEVVLLDLSLPDGQGFETFRRAHRLIEAPIVVVSGFGDETLAVRAVMEGAQDYLVKGHFDGEGLSRSIRYARERHRLEAQRRRVEVALRQSEERYRRFFEEDLTGDCVVAASGEILACNPSFVKIFGFSSPEEALEARLEDIFPDPAGRDYLLTELNGNGKVERFQLQGRRQGGRPVFVIGNAVGTFDEQRQLAEFRAYLFDDTERQQAEEQLRQSQKMEAVGRLAGGVAHDFSNILTAISFHAAYLGSRLPEGDSLRDRATDIKNAAQRAAGLTTQLLAFSRRQVSRPKLVDLNQVVSEVKGLFLRVLGEDIRIHTELAEDLGRVRADPAQLEQVVVNLVVNARDAMPRGGVLDLVTEDRTVEKERRGPLGGMLTPGRWVVLRVRDTGEGMDEETRRNAFEPFFTTKDRSKGTGLGLSTVYGIVKQNQGHIELESEPGLGTTFEIFFPQVRQVGELPSRAEVAEPVERGGETILVVEDDNALRHLIGEALRLRGFHVLLAPSGREARELVQGIEGEIHCVVTDVVLFDLRGPELLEMLKELRPELKALFISGYVPDSNLQNTIETTRVPLLEKPFSAAALVRRVRDILDDTPAVKV